MEILHFQGFIYLYFRPILILLYLPILPVKREGGR
jgi:hypothetical protein